MLQMCSQRLANHDRDQRKSRLLLKSDDTYSGNHQMDFLDTTI